ncbi:MAG: hypothetical protein KGZ88_20610 [Methylomicrobium sp.]|nr:hypothetical protein [Methylomicrobium sp.]
MNNLPEDLDLTSSKLDNTEKAQNELVTKIVIHLDLIDFNLSDSNADVLGAAYVYLISEFAICAGKDTPPQASILLAKLITCQNKKRKMSMAQRVLLLRVKKEVVQQYKIKIWIGTIDYG